MEDGIPAFIWTLVGVAVVVRSCWRIDACGSTSSYECFEVSIARDFVIYAKEVEKWKASV